MVHRLYPNIAVVPDGQQPVYATSAVSHFYADGTSGSDLNDGLTVGTPKKTLAAVFALVPEVIKHNTAVHLSGVFSEQGTTIIMRYFANSAYFIIDGGTSTTVVADNSGSPWVADIHSTTSIGKVGAGWSVDQYAGYWVEIVDGVLAGTKAMVQGNTADTLTPLKNFASDPGTAQFRIVRPSTELSASTTTSKLQFTIGGNGYVYVQNMYLSGSKSYFHVESSTGLICFGGIISDSTAMNSFLISRGVGGVAVADYGYDSDMFSFYYLPGGVSVRQSGKKFRVMVSQVGVFGSYIDTLSMDGCSVGSTRFMMSGSRVKSAFIAGSMPAARTDEANWEINNTSGYATTKLGGGVVGLKLVNSAIRIVACTISDCSSHGIECIQSRLELKGAVTGTGNGGVGLYAHQGSQVTIAGATPPTVTGVLGEVAVTSDDLTTPMTWSEIVAAGGVSSAQEATVIKVS